MSQGERFVLPPGLLPGHGLLRLPDQARLGAFAESLRSAIAAAGYTAPQAAEGMGPESSGGTGIAEHCFLASAALAAITLGNVGKGIRSPSRGRSGSHSADAARRGWLDVTPVLGTSAVRPSCIAASSKSLATAVARQSTLAMVPRHAAVRHAHGYSSGGCDSSIASA